MKDNWKPKVYIRGAALGLVTGLLAAYLYSRAAEETDSHMPAPIKSADLIKVSLSILSLIRQVTELGNRK